MNCTGESTGTHDLRSPGEVVAPYGGVAKLLHDVLPLDRKHRAVTVRNHTLQAARRQEELLGEEQPLFLESTPAERAALPIPDGPLAVGLDGGIVRARRCATGAHRPAQCSSSAPGVWRRGRWAPTRKRGPWSAGWRA